MQHTSENRITAEVALIYKKEENKKYYKRKKTKERNRKEDKLGREKRIKTDGIERIGRRRK